MKVAVNNLSEVPEFPKRAFWLQLTEYTGERIEPDVTVNEAEYWLNLEDALAECTQRTAAEAKKDRPYIHHRDEYESAHWTILEREHDGYVVAPNYTLVGVYART